MDAVTQGAWKQWALVALLGSCMMLPRLGRQVLWQDEAQSALLARTVLNTGIPHGIDGKNYLSEESGAEYGADYVWHWHPWLSFYIQALSFRCLGQNTFAARLPSTLFGIGLLLLVYGFTKKRWGSDRALLACLILGLNVTFILLSRQCRFYSMGSFFAFWSITSYLDALEHRPKALASLFFALVCLIHTFHFFYGITAVALVLHALVFRRKDAGASIGIVILSFIINVPWFLWFNGFSFLSHHSPSSIRTFDCVFMAKRASAFAQRIMQDGFTLPLGLFGITLVVFQWKKSIRTLLLEDKALSLFAVFIVTQFLFATVLAPNPHVRYLAPVFAPCAILSALVIYKIIHWDIYLGSALLAVSLSGRPVAQYVYEMTYGVTGTIDHLVEFFQQHGAKDQIVLTNYEDMPLKFYTPMHVIGGLTGEDLSPALQADWIVLLQHSYAWERSVRIPEFVQTHLKRTEYDMVPLPYPDSMLQNREEQDVHAFRSPEGPPYMVIMRRKPNAKR